MSEKTKAVLIRRDFGYSEIIGVFKDRKAAEAHVVFLGHKMGDRRDSPVYTIAEVENF